MLRTSKGVAGVLARTMLCAVFLAAALGFTVPNASDLELIDEGEPFTLV